MKYAYPVAISYEPDGNPKSNDYLVYIPDFTKGPATEGKDLVDGLEMAESQLLLMMDELKKPSKCLRCTRDTKQFSNATASLVVMDLGKLRKQCAKSVRKIISMPTYLNEKALEAKINFSQPL